MKPSAFLIGGLSALLVHHASAAAATHPVEGWWQTRDDDSGRAVSIVHITQEGPTLSGTVERVLDASKAGMTCEPCKDDRKGKPLQGLEIIRGVSVAPTGPDTWQSGEILDPRSGKTYRLRLHLTGGGDMLEVRGYFGNPFFGRTQQWVRVPSEQAKTP